MRVPGTAVFMHRTREVIPSALLHSLKHYKALHKQVILLTVMTEEVSHLRDDERLQFEELGEGIYRVTGRYGYMEEPDIPALLERVSEEHGLNVPPMDTTYFLGRETLIVTDAPKRHGHVARKDLRLDDAQRRERRALLPPAAEPGGGAGRADRVLSRTTRRPPAGRHGRQRLSKHVRSRDGPFRRQACVEARPTSAAGRAGPPEASRSVFLAAARVN